MENLHLKNINNDPRKTLPTNQKYLNKVFSTPNLSLENFSKTFILHDNFLFSSTKTNFINDLYEVYKTNLTNYKQLTFKLVLYNIHYMNNKPYYHHVDFSNIIIQTYTEDQIIKELYNENEQKLFYEYVDKLQEIRDNKFPHIKSAIQTNEVTKEYHLSTLLIALKSDLTEEERLNALPKNLTIPKLNGDDKKNIIKNIISNKPNFKLQEEKIINKTIKGDSYHLLKMLREFQLIKLKKREAKEH